MESGHLADDGGCEWSRVLFTNNMKMVWYLPGTDSRGGTLAAMADRQRSMSAHRAGARPSPTIARDRGNDQTTAGTAPPARWRISISAVVDFIMVMMTIYDDYDLLLLILTWWCRDDIDDGDGVLESIDIWN